MKDRRPRRRPSATRLPRAMPIFAPVGKGGFIGLVELSWGGIGVGGGVVLKSPAAYAIVGVFEGCSRSDSSSNYRAEDGNTERCKFDSDHGHSPENGARALYNDTVYIPLGTKPEAVSHEYCCTYNGSRNGEVIRRTYTRTLENDCKPTAVQSWRVVGRNVVSSCGLPIGIISSSFSIMDKYCRWQPGFCPCLKAVTWSGKCCCKR